MTKKAEVVRVCLLPDANCLLSVMDHCLHPHGLSDMDFDEIFTTDKPVIFSFRCYPW